MQDIAALEVRQQRAMAAHSKAAASQAAAAEDADGDTSMDFVTDMGPSSTTAANATTLTSTEAATITAGEAATALTSRSATALDHTGATAADLDSDGRPKPGQPRDGKGTVVHRSADGTDADGGSGSGSDSDMSVEDEQGSRSRDTERSRQPGAAALNSGLAEKSSNGSLDAGVTPRPSQASVAARQ